MQSDNAKKYHIITKKVPTFYFIGVTTTKSSIMKVFPLWVRELGRPEIVIEGLIQLAKTWLNLLIRFFQPCHIYLNPHSQTLEYAAGRGFRSKVIERSLLRLGEGLAGASRGAASGQRA